MSHGNDCKIAVKYILLGIQLEARSALRDLRVEIEELQGKLGADGKELASIVIYEEQIKQIEEDIAVSYETFKAEANLWNMVVKIISLEVCYICSHKRIFRL